MANFKKLRRLLFRKSRRLLPLHSKAINPDQVVDLGQFVTFPDGYRPTNPSVVRYGSDLLINIRGVAYLFDVKRGVYGDWDRLPSLNRSFLLNNDLTFKGGTKLPQERFDNVEDLKLFSGLGRVWGVASVRFKDPHVRNASVINLVEFDADLTDCRFIQLPSPFNLKTEKNWAPFFFDGALHFVYSCQPNLLLRYESASGALEFVGPRRHDLSALQFLEGGSSGGFQTDSGIVFLTHRRVVRLPSRRRIYLSRISRLSEDFMRFDGGPFFSIGQPTIQFSNGMLLEKDRVLIAYGQMDASARLACFSRDRFERALFPAR